tara:strand:+ start:949 stop:1107 length:159 start_codon:yes stop_codon:yes gene_type:complete
MKTYKGNPFDKPEEKKQCDIHVVVKPFYCDDAIERLRKCKNQCKFCETLSSE